MAVALVGADVVALVGAAVTLPALAVGAFVCVGAYVGGIAVGIGVGVGVGF